MLDALDGVVCFIVATRSPSKASRKGHENVNSRLLVPFKILFPIIMLLYGRHINVPRRGITKRRQVSIKRKKQSDDNLMPLHVVSRDYEECVSIDQGNSFFVLQFLMTKLFSIRLLKNVSTEPLTNSSSHSNRQAHRRRMVIILNVLLHCLLTLSAGHNEAREQTNFSNCSSIVLSSFHPN